MQEFESHHALTGVGIKIDYVFAFPDYDEATGEPTNNAINKGGIKALGVARKLNLKDRTKGLGDAEILLDGDWWEDATEKERRALLDHELHHLVATSKVDDLGRPKLKLRKHDFEVGWFHIIAQRHGVHSQEQKQAGFIMESAGQFYWPAIAQQAASSGRMGKVEVRK